MDEQLVLTAQILKLNPDVQRAEAAEDTYILKNIPARRYLTVTTEQWNLLRNFSNPATVPDVMRAVLLNRSCVPLREFYELILKAQRAGILRMAQQIEPVVTASRWPLSLSPTIPLVLTLLSLIGAVVSLALRPFPLHPWPPAWMDLAIGWGLVCVGLSLGNVLAASVLRYGGGEVYEPRFRWLRPAPYFGVNLEDSCMISRAAQAGVWSARLLPVLATAAALWWFRPSWGAVHIVAVLVLLRPFAEGCMVELISSTCRGRVLDTQKKLIFSLNRRWNVRLRFGFARVSALYVTARLLWGLAWSVLVMFMAVRAANLEMKDVFGSAAYWRDVVLVFAGVAALAALVSIGRPVLRSLYLIFHSRYQRCRQTWSRWRVKLDDIVSPEHASQVLTDSLLFRRLAPAERAELLRKGRPTSYKAFKTFHTFTDKAKDVGIILSGRVAVYHRLKSGRAERVLVLREGDVFGAHALLDPERQHVQLRALSPVVALMVPMEEFQQRIVNKLGIPATNDLVHKVPFLRNLPLCYGWHPQAIARFAQLASTSTYGVDEVIIADRQDSQQFYVVYEGRVLVKRERKVLDRLRAGAFFGEISLLQNSSAVADVITREPTRCLTITKSDFLRFVTHNPQVGLQLEAISSRRLGRPIFPLHGTSFEVR